jgi:hypothetical protein
VAGGHLTDAPVDSVYSGVVLQRNPRICIFLAELNDLQVHAADIGNAYLEAETTKEKVYIIPTLYVTWVSYLSRRTLTSGCEGTATYGSILPHTLTTMQLL